jgi:sodium pump decarboxylase gamma subunit
MKINMLMNLSLAAQGRGLNEIVEMIKANPEAINTLTANEKTSLILFVAGLGMAVTFAVLLFLWLSIVVLSKVLGGFEKSTAKPTKVQEVPQVAVAAVEEETEEEEDEELVAVIAAAVAASLNTSIHNIVVKNIVRVNDHSPAWAKTGRIEQMNTRF